MPQSELQLLLLLFTLAMMQEFIEVKLLYEDQCTITNLAT